MELTNVPRSRASSLADVSDSRCSFDDSDTKLRVDEIKSERSVSGTLPFAAAGIDYEGYKDDQETLQDFVTKRDAGRRMR